MTGILGVRDKGTLTFHCEDQRTENPSGISSTISRKREAQGKRVVKDVRHSEGELLLLGASFSAISH